LRYDDAHREVETLREALEQSKSQFAQLFALAEPATTSAPTMLVDKSSAVTAAQSEIGEAQVSSCPQPISAIKGIGRTYAQRLYAAGVGTFWEVANLSDEDFIRILELSGKKLQRVNFEAIRKAARQLAEKTNSIGRLWDGRPPDDFEPLEGIGKTYAKRLYEAGICTFEALANTSVERLMEICPPTKLKRPDYLGWIEQARERISAPRG
ncbi:MAG: helix-hairpin-helix domain-containing protein, partial [Anaerolineae bacterium]|nr:helix-hairpin-helix domain-containing protein [Anaerolineae bacterium]